MVNRIMNAPTPSPPKPRVGLFIGWALLLSGGFFLTMVVLKEGRLALFGQHTNAVVEKVTEITQSHTLSKYTSDGKRRTGDRKRTSISQVMQLGFITADGKPISFETLATFNTEAKVGDTQPIVYLPSDPMRAKIATLRQLWLPMLTGLLLSVLCLGGGVLLVKLRPSPLPQP